MPAIEIGTDRLALAVDGRLLREQRALPDAAAMRALLAAGPPVPDGPAVLLVPGDQAPEVLGSHLIAARVAGLRPAAFVDAGLLAGAAFAHLSPEFAAGRIPLVHVELGPQSGAVTLLRADDRGAGVRRRAALDFGIAILERDLLRLATRAIVRGTRFDPLHDARHEQALRELLDELSPELASSGTARGVLCANGREFELAMSADQVLGALEPRIEELRAAIARLQPGDGAALVVPAAFARLPGAASRLASATGLAAWREEDGGALRLASQLADVAEPDGAAVPLLRRLGPSRLPPSSTLAPIDRAPVAAGTAPTHLVAGGVAHRIDAGGLVLGRAPPAVAGADAPRPLALGAGLAGISRRHCTVRREGEGVVVVDHSRHGSFVDGRRVVGRARLVAGNRLRLGTPGTQIELVAVLA